MNAVTWGGFGGDSPLLHKQRAGKAYPEVAREMGTRPRKSREHRQHRMSWVVLC